MVSTALLIGGPPGAGKTTLGRAVAARLGWASLTVDDLLIAIRSATSPASHPALHPVAGLGHVRYFTDGPPDKLIADATVLQDATWPIVERVVRYRHAKRSPVVVDWWLLDPHRVVVSTLEGLASVWLHVDDDVLLQRERASHDFFDGSPDPERMLDNYMARSLWRNEYIRLAADELDLPVIHQNGDRSVEELVDEVIARAGLA